MYHPFFNTPEGIPETIESSALKKPPSWLDSRTVPREMKAGTAKVAPEELIRACGFGSASRLAMFHQLFQEESEGRAPVLPLQSVYEVPKISDTRNSPVNLNSRAIMAVAKKARAPKSTMRVLNAQDSTAVKETTPDLEGLLAHVKSSLRGEAETSTASHLRPRPLVTRFVDFSEQGGMGYVLANGVTGCLVSRKKPVKSILLTNALRPDLSRVPPAWPSNMSQLIPDKVDTDVYIYERDASGAMRRLTLPYATFLKSFPSSSPSIAASSASSASHDDLPAAKRQLLNNHEKITSALVRDHPGPARLRTSEPITSVVARYQQVGNVTVWSWSDHSLQVDFPDHTKLRLSADGAWAAFHYPPQPPGTSATLSPEPWEQERERPHGRRPAPPGARALQPLPQQPLRVQPRRPGKPAPAAERAPLVPRRAAPPPPRPARKAAAPAKRPRQHEAEGAAEDAEGPVLALPLAALLAVDPRTGAGLNAVAVRFGLRSKAKFVYQLVDCWRRHGRIGRMGGERLFWGDAEGRDGMCWATTEL